MLCTEQVSHTKGQMALAFVVIQSECSFTDAHSKVEPVICHVPDP
jgi:hypothetical protein